MEIDVLRERRVAARATLCQVFDELVSEPQTGLLGHEGARA